MDADRFLNPPRSLDRLDTYVIRTALLRALNGALPRLRGTLLDVGCGEMPYRTHILTNSHVERYIGLDIRNAAYQTRVQPDLFWEGATIPLPDDSVDSAIATELFEHLPDLDGVLREICRVLRPNGTLFFTVPFLWPLHDSPHDYCRYTPFALRTHLEACQFEVSALSALGGWNASLAQMIGLWLNRSGLCAAERQAYYARLGPFYDQLLRADQVPSKITDQLMSPGFHGVAVKRCEAASRPGRVVIVEEGFPSVSETFILNQITGLVDRGVHPENWALKRLHSATTHRQADEYHLVDRTTYLDVPPREFRGDRARWLAEFTRRNPDVRTEGIGAFHLHFGPTFVQLEPLFAESNAFVMVSFHGYDASEVLKRRGAGYYAGLFNRANAITVPSAAMRATLVASGCPAEKIVIHHYGIDPDQREPDTTTPPAPINFLTIGRLVEKKGIEDSIRALASLPDRAQVTYRIIGEGPQHGALRQLIEELHLQSIVEISGFIPNEQVCEILRHTDVFVLTSRTASNGDMEGLPVCLIEAQMAGVPVISTRHAGIPELVRDRETGLLCEEGNVAQIRDAMRALIDDPALRRRYGAAGRAHAQEHFNIHRLNDRLAQLLTEGARQSARPSASARVEAVRGPAPATAAAESTLPLISVCIPTYNRGAFLGACLRSVLDQADNQIEVIVVDDGSTDDTEDVVRRLARPEIRYIKKAHTNGSDTRNRAIAESAGDSILWVDSDDLLLPGALRAIRQTMRTHAEADVYYGHLKIFGDTRQFPAAEILPEDYWGRNDYLLSRLVSHNRIPHGGTVVRKSLYDRAGVYDPTFVRAHDYEFWCRAASIATFRHVGVFTYLWRWHDTNMSSSSVAVDTTFEARVVKMLARDHTIEALFPLANWTDRNSSLIFAYLHLAKAFIKWRDKLEAFAYVERAVQVINPAWHLPESPDEVKWHVVSLLVSETFKDAPKTIAAFTRGIAAIQQRKGVAPAGAPDQAFHLGKLVQLAGRLKARKGDAATAEQLKAELLQKLRPESAVAGGPLVSVVIPFYRQADTVAATLDSLSAQTYRAFEVVIVSDGDREFPDDVLEAFQRQNPDIPVRYELKEHSGLAATRNLAIERARGAYVLPLDSDDLIASIFLEKTVPVLEGNARLGFVYTETLFFGEKNEIWSHVDFDPALLLQRNLMTCTTLFRRDMWAAIGGYRTNMTHGYEDWDFWIGAVEHGYTAANIHLPLFMYRRKTQSMLESRHQFDRLAKEQIIRNHPVLFHEISDANRPLLDGAAVGRIPDSFVRVGPRQPGVGEYAAVNASPAVIRQAKKKILFICHDFPPYRYAGAQLYALNLAKEFTRLGTMDVDILHPVFREKYDRVAIAEADVEGLKVFRLSKRKTAGYERSVTHPDVEGVLDTFLAGRRYDAVHIHGLGQLSAAPIDVAKRHGIPVVMTLHDYWLLCAFWHLMTPDQQLCSGPESVEKCAQCFLRHGRPGSHTPADTIEFMQTRFAVFRERFRQVDCAVAPSRYLARVFEKFGFHGAHVRSLGMPAMRPVPKVAHTGLVFGFAGQIIARKGIEVLLRAFSRITTADVSLEIWGRSGDHAYLDRIMRLCEDVPNIRFRGDYTPDQLPAIFSGIDVAVVPSLMENYPLVVQEAFMNGTPVVASNAGGIPEAIVNDHNGLLFEAGNPLDLERKLEYLVSHPESIAAYAANIPPARTIGDDATFYSDIYNRLAPMGLPMAGDDAVAPGRVSLAALDR